MGLPVPVDVQRECPTKLVVLGAIGVEECANNFVARCVRPIGLSRELRHRSPLSLFEDALTTANGIRATFP